jgi:hypothetical protein
MSRSKNKADMGKKAVFVLLVGYFSLLDALQSAILVIVMSLEQT